jgi:hypothetical protein
MTTFAYALVDSVDARWSEINLLIIEAESRSNNIDFYNALCRSISVLMIAQFEGFIKDTARAVIDDINKFSSFKEAPSALKQRFCRSFLEKENEKGSEELQGRITKLIGMFDGLETQFTLEPFLVKDVQDHDKNPSPSVIDRITANFGVRDFFKSINGSDLDSIFSDTSSEIEKLKIKLRDHVILGIEHYPYKLKPINFNIGLNTLETNVSSKKVRTLWQDFLDNMMARRHGIAHGSISENPNSIEEIRNSLMKLEILQLAILMVICEKVTLVNQ